MSIDVHELKPQRPEPSNTAEALSLANSPQAPVINAPVLLLTALLIGTLGANYYGHINDDLALALTLVIVFVTIFVGLRSRWVDAPISKRVLRLGTPVVLAMMSQSAVNVVDTMFVGRLPADVALPGVAGIGISLPLFWIVGGFLSAISVGTLAITARRQGQEKDDEAGHTLMNAVLLALVLGIAFSVAGYYALPHVLPFFNADPNVAEQALIFSRIRYLGITAMVLTAAYKAFFDGTGRTHIHMIAAIVMNVVNVFLCYGLILGHFGLPRMEVAGAAWSSTISSFIGTAVMIAYTFKPSILDRYKLYRRGSVRLSTTGSIIRLSLPSGFATIIAMLGFLLFHKAVAAVDAEEATGLPINASATAVLQQVVMLVFLVAFSFGTATATLVSQSLGAAQPNLAARYAVESVKIGTILMAGMSAIVFIFPEELIAAFIKSEALGEQGKALAIVAGTAPLRVIAAASVLIAAAVIFTQTLYGAGNTVFVMIVEGILHIFCLVPLAWLLGVVLHWGLMGTWAAVAIYIVLLAGIMGVKFAGSGWKEIRL